MKTRLGSQLAFYECECGESFVDTESAREHAQECDGLGLL